MLEIDKIKIDGIQSRVEISESTVSEYADAILEGAQFPPIIVFYDGGNFWLADGYHRLLAHKRAGKTAIYEQRELGGQRDAMLYSVGANASHGLRRTNADKRNAVLMLLNDPEWSQWSDNAIAKACHVDNKTVTTIRAAHLGNSEIETEVGTEAHLGNPKLETERTYTTKHGTTAKMNTANIGRVAKPIADPEQEQREIEQLEQLLREVTDSLEDALAALADLGSPNQKEYMTEIGKLRAELRAVEATRDALQNENAALKRHIKRLEREARKTRDTIPRRAVS